MYICFLDNNFFLFDRYVIDLFLVFGIFWVFVVIVKFFFFKKLFVIIFYFKFIFCLCCI